jgi:hypothetical protein
LLSRGKVGAILPRRVELSVDIRARVLVAALPFARVDIRVDDDSSRSAPPRSGGHQRAELMQRTFAFDVLALPRYVGRLCPVVLIEQASARKG